jgi:hypothetical protein
VDKNNVETESYIHLTDRESRDNKEPKPDVETCLHACGKELDGTMLYYLTIQLFRTENSRVAFLKFLGIVGARECTCVDVLCNHYREPYRCIVSTPCMRRQLLAAEIRHDGSNQTGRIRVRSNVIKRFLIQNDKADLAGVRDFPASGQSWQSVIVMPSN